MFDLYSYEYVRSVNQERLDRALARRRMLRSEQDTTDPDSGGEVIEVLFVSGCSADELSA